MADTPCYHFRLRAEVTVSVRADAYNPDCEETPLAQEEENARETLIMEIEAGRGEVTVEELDSPKPLDQEDD